MSPVLKIDVMADMLHSQNGQQDQLDGGAGTDSAHPDKGLDQLVSVEKLIA